MMDELMAMMENVPLEVVVLTWKEGDNAKSICKSDTGAEDCMPLGFHVVEGMAKEMLKDFTISELAAIMHHAVDQIVERLEKEEE